MAMSIWLWSMIWAPVTGISVQGPGPVRTGAPPGRSAPDQADPRRASPRSQVLVSKAPFWLQSSQI